MTTAGHARTEPRRAATVVLVRDGAASGGMQVLLLERGRSSDHTSGAWVFPGGVLEPQDEGGGADAAAAYVRAAMRECVEECGIHLDSPSQLHWFAHWLTPKGRPKRFDTRFFVALAPEGRDPVVDAGEIVAHAWMTPAEALAGEFGANLMTPTRATLETLARFASARDVVAWARTLREIPCSQPRLAQRESGLCSIPPGHPAYDEVGLLDPDDRGAAWCVMRAGVPVVLAPGLVRTCDAEGTNHYRVGSDREGWRDLAPGEVLWLEGERIVVAADAEKVPQAARGAARWLAPARGFLVRLP